MNLMINPGSTIGENQEGWTNTHDFAKQNAIKWFVEPMKTQGFTDIVMVDTGKEIEGRWLFVFTHTITGKKVELETHGIDNLEAYEKQYIFTPRVYWNGSSSSSPELEQFAADGYEPVMTYRKK